MEEDSSSNSDLDDSQKSSEDEDSQEDVRGKNDYLAKTLNQHKKEIAVLKNNVYFYEKQLYQKDLITKRLLQYTENINKLTNEQFTKIINFAQSNTTLIELSSKAENFALKNGNVPIVSKGQKNECGLLRKSLKEINLNYKALANYVGEMTIEIRNCCKNVVALIDSATNLVEHANNAEKFALKALVPVNTQDETVNEQDETTNNLSKINGNEKLSTTDSLSNLSENTENRETLENLSNKELSMIQEENEMTVNSSNETPTIKNQSMKISRLKTTIMECLRESEKLNKSKCTDLDGSHSPKPSSSSSSSSSSSFLSSKVRNKSITKYYKRDSKTISFGEQKRSISYTKNEETLSTPLLNNIENIDGPTSYSTPIEQPQNRQSGFITKRGKYPMVYLEPLKLSLINNDENSVPNNTEVPSSMKIKAKPKRKKSKNDNETVSTSSISPSFKKPTKKRRNDSKIEENNVVAENISQRPKRSSRPKTLKEPSLLKKLRRSK